MNSGAKMQTLVLWDVRSCPLPDEKECRHLVGTLRSTVFKYIPCGLTMEAHGIDDDIPISIARHLHIGLDLFGSPSETEAHVQNLIHRMKYWAENYPAPSNILVISGNNALSSALEDFRSRNYNILVAHPGDDDDHADLVSSASYVWKLTTLICGGPPYRIDRSKFACSEEVIPRAEVGTLVVWDVRSCPLTEEELCRRLVGTVRSAVFKYIPCDKIAMQAYGIDDDFPVSFIADHLVGLYLLGNNPETHVQDMITGMKNWAENNPAPANFLVISDNEALSSALKDFRSRNYNVILAHPPHGYRPELFAAATSLWNFTSLINGGSPISLKRKWHSIAAD